MKPDPLYAEHIASHNADWWRDVPEPNELTTQCDAISAKRAADEREAATLCAACGKRRDHIDHLYVASRNRVACQFEEPA